MFAKVCVCGGGLGGLVRLKNECTKEQNPNQIEGSLRRMGVRLLAVS